MGKVVLCLMAIITFQDSFSKSVSIEGPDTLINIPSPSKLVITENENGMKVTVSGNENDEAFSVSAFTEYTPDASVKTSKISDNEKYFPHCIGILIAFGERKSKFNLIGTGVSIGLINPVNQYPEGGLQWSKSFEISWLMCCGLQYSFSNSSSLSFGLGFDWRNYKITTSDKCLVTNEYNGLEWGKYPEGIRGKYSRLKTFSLQLPLLFSYKIPKSSLYFKCGPIFDFNTYASVLTAYEDKLGNNSESFTKSVSPKRFTIDIFGSLSLRNTIGVYVRYSPMKVMDSYITLNFQPFSTGITLFI